MRVDIRVEKRDFTFFRDLFSVQSNVEDWEDEIKENESVVSNYFGQKQDHYKESLLPEKPLEEQVYRASVKYLSLEIPMGNIYFVDDVESLRLCQRAVSKVGLGYAWENTNTLVNLTDRCPLFETRLA